MPCSLILPTHPPSTIHHLYIRNTPNNVTASKVPAQAGTARFVLLFLLLHCQKRKHNFLHAIKIPLAAGTQHTTEPFLLALNITNDCKFLGVIAAAVCEHAP